MGPKRGARKRPYPHEGDVREAVVEALGRVLRPDDLPDAVRGVLEERGFYAGLVTDRRVWRAYEELVRAGRIPDVLGVVPDLGEEPEGG